MWAGSKGRCRRHGHGVDGRSIADAVRRFRDGVKRFVIGRSGVGEEFFSRNDCFGRWRQECHTGPDACRNRSRHWESSCAALMSSACLRRPKRPLPSRCWRMRPGIAGPRMFRLLRARDKRLCWGRFRMRRSATLGAGRRNPPLRQAQGRLSRAKNTREMGTQLGLGRPRSKV